MSLSEFLPRALPVFAVWALLHWYGYRRLVRPAGWRAGLKRLATAYCMLGAVLPAAALTVERARVTGPWHFPFTYVAFLCAGFSASTLMLLVARDGPYAVAAVWRFVFRRGKKSAAAAAPAVEERRAFLLRATNAGVLVTSAGGFSLAAYNGAKAPRLVEVEIRVEDLPEALDGFSIAQLSDVHIGPIHDGDYLRAAVERVNALKPDLVAVTGDLVDGVVEDLRDAVACLADLKSRHGTWFVSGNHEFYWDVDAWTAELRRIGLTVLENEHRVVDHDGARLIVAGVHDFSGPRHAVPKESDPFKAFDGAPEGGFRLLLAHQPKSVFKASGAGAQLQLSGHTHGGQFFPFTFVIPIFQRYVAGLYRHVNKLTGANVALYVHRGTGSWGPPLRLGSPKEIALIRLRRAAE